MTRRSCLREEADRCYGGLTQQWQEEEDMLRQVLAKVAETVECTLMERLEASAELEEELLQRRRSLVEQLLSRSSSLAKDQSLGNHIDTNNLAKNSRLK